MSVIRVFKDKNYTVMSNIHLRDKNLSLKAKGLLSLMLSLPDDWSYSLAGLCAICKESETAVKSALNELKTNGYVVVNREEPSKENGGRICYSYDVYEKPISEKQDSEIQGVENLGVEFDPLLNTNKQNTNNKHYSSTELKVCDFDNGIIAKIKSLTSETVLIDCLVSYLKKYKEVKGVNHPDISMACLSDFLETADYLFDGYYDDLKADDGFEKMIDRHFACRYKQKIDYKFQHFASSKILEYQARYFGYIDGYKE